MTKRHVFFTLRVLVFLGLVICMTGCASTGVTRIGSKTYPALPEDHEVAIFTDESQVGEQFEVIALISHSNPGKYQVLTLADAIPDLKRKAREVGADGIIVDKSSQVRSGIISRGMYIEARAIRIQRGKVGP